MGTAHGARVPFVENLPGLRGTALVTLAPIAGSAPCEYGTDGVGARGLKTEEICAALLDMLAAGTRTSCEINGGAPDSAAGGWVGCAAPPSNCYLPVQKVPGWRAFGFPPGSCAAPRCIT